MEQTDQPASYSSKKQGFIAARDAFLDETRRHFGESLDEQIGGFIKKTTEDLFRENVLHTKLAGIIGQGTVSDRIDQDELHFWDGATALIKAAQRDLLNSQLHNNEHGRNEMANTLATLAEDIDRVEMAQHPTTPKKEIIKPKGRFDIGSTTTARSV